MRPAADEDGTNDEAVALEHVTKRFASRDAGRDAHPVLDDVTIRVKRGELMVVVGPSGCGKSTTLRILAGLEHADGGDVRIGGVSALRVPPQERDVAMVFQGYALYPQMTVRENIEFPLRMRKVDGPERRRRADDAARMLRLERLMDRLPAQLSGGERQRVAMGRAIVRRPRVFLFDEPLSNLDAALREELRSEIGRVVRELGATAVYVTHDQVEAMTLGARICVMKRGRVQQIGTPREIYERPATSFVGTFLGAPRMNLLDAHVDGGLATAGPFRVPLSHATAPARVTLGVRPEDVRLVDGVPGETTAPHAEMEVVLTEPLGAETSFVVRAADVTLRLRVPGFDPRPPGTRVAVTIDPARCHVFEQGDEGARLGDAPA